MKLFVPAYVINANLNTLYSQHPTVNRIIVNHGNGPGSTKDTTLAGHMLAAQKNSIQVIGYVNTGHTSIPVSIVKRQIDAWYSRYGPQIDGIYFDNVDGSGGALSEIKARYYGLIAEYVTRQVGGSGVNHVSFGCGGKFPQEYLAMCSTISVWEYGFNGTTNNFPSKANLSPWVYDKKTYGYGEDRFVGWLYAGTSAPTLLHAQTFIDVCHACNIGSVFIVDAQSYSTLISLALWAQIIPYVAGK